MSGLDKIYGAKARLFLSYSGTIEGLAEELRESLELKEFRVEFDKYPPHEKVGASETLGFEMWLEQSNLLPNFPYIFEVSTQMVSNEVFDGRLHDLSLWLGKFVAIPGKMDCFVLVDEKEMEGYLFNNRSVKLVKL